VPTDAVRTAAAARRDAVRKPCAVRVRGALFPSEYENDTIAGCARSGAVDLRGSRGREEGFEAEYPDVDLVIANIPEEDHSTKVQMAIAAGEPPDIGSVWDRSFIEAGQVLPLDDIVEEKGDRPGHVRQGDRGRRGRGR
jgi:hypothetical protein